MPDSLIFQALFESIQRLSVGDSGHSVTLTVSVSLSGKGEWKGVEINADVSLSASFVCCYVWFNLPIAISSELVAKHPSAFDVLLVNAARPDELPGKPKLFLSKNFLFQPTDPSFIGSREETQSIFSLA